MTSFKFNQGDRVSTIVTGQVRTGRVISRGFKSIALTTSSTSQPPIPDYNQKQYLVKLENVSIPYAVMEEDLFAPGTAPANHTHTKAVSQAVH